MKSFVVIFLGLIFSQFLYGASAFRNGQVITFTWDKLASGKTQSLEVKINHRSSKPKIFKVKGNSFDLRLKKMPKNIFWRVGEADFQELNLDQKFLFKTGGGIENSDYSFESSSVNENGKAGGNNIYFTGEYFPESFKGNKSLRFGYMSSSTKNGDKQFEKKEFTFEVSQILNHRTNHHQIYLGYYLYDLNFSSESDEGKYTAHFISTKYLFRKPLSQKFDFEFLASLRLPYPVRVQVSATLRPSLVFKWNENIGVETFLSYDKFSARERDKNLNQVIEIKSTSFGAGAGLVIRI